ncbi:UDP-3-O-acyl-N-acetylglucosamine deacetylase [bacterium]|nr:UDP-3-O-acyl-N-acetylglucosamine deacetylase [bacterium]
MAYQMSIKEPVEVKGVNIYTGRKNHAIFHPAEEDTGIIFYLRGTRIPASLENAHYGFCAIDIERGRKKVRLVEHPLSPVYALGIDNVIIDVPDGVCPTTDNSAKEYFGKLKGARIPQSSKKKFWRYEGKGTKVGDNSRPDSLTVGPSEGFVIDYRAYYPHKVVGKQQFRLEVNERNYENDIMEAKSPGFVDTPFKKFLFFLRKNGPLGKFGWHGINEKNYLIISSKDSENYGNPEGFGPKYGEKDFVRHKILDELGTLALTGRQFKDTEFRFNMTGHRFDLYALKKLFRENCFEECE